MKFKLLFLSLFVSIASYGQINDLMKLSNGSFKKTFTVYDSKQNVFGYLLLYEMGKSNDRVNLEYTFLDKNLNSIVNGKFTEPNYKNNTLFKEDSLHVIYKNCYLSDKNLILEKEYSLISSKKIIETYSSCGLATTIRFIPLDKSIVTQELYFDNDSIRVFPDNLNEFVKNTVVKGKIAKSSKSKSEIINRITFLNSNTNSGFLKVYQSKIEFLNKNNRVTLQYKIEHTDNDITSPIFEVKLFCDSTLYIEQSIERKSDNRKIRSDEYISLVALNVSSGEKIWEIELKNKTQKLNYSYEVKMFDNKTYLIGNFIDPNAKKLSVGFDVLANESMLAINNSLENTMKFVQDLRLAYSNGFFVKVLDKNGSIVNDRLIKWADMSSKIAIDELGLIDKKYKLITKNNFLLENGSLYMLAEKRNYKNNSEISGYAFITFDSVFNITVIEDRMQEKAKFSVSNYLFSQYFNSGNSIAFFNLAPSNIKKEVAMNINTLNNGILKEDKIILYSKNDNTVLYPYPAKEGYFLINEVNEKEKSNILRLEKINY